MVLSQVVNGVVLPFVLIFMLLLTNDRELMGKRTSTRGTFNVDRLDHRGRDDRAHARDAHHAAVTVEAGFRFSTSVAAGETKPGFDRYRALQLKLAASSVLPAPE